MAAVSSFGPLLKAYDHGEPISVHAQDVGATGDRWVEPFLAANTAGLRRLGIHHEIHADPALRVMLRPGPRIGAIPLLSPATRRVAAVLLVEPRFRWTVWATVQVPRGAWATFPCRFSEPDDDPELLASVRWTLSRLTEDLSSVASSPPARYLLGRAAELRSAVGTGALRRPRSGWAHSGASAWEAEAVQAMSWVAEERGLGGARSLDGLAWDLSIEALWEAWVTAFTADVGRQLGMVASPFRAARRPLRWHGPAQSMSALIPDVELRGAERVIWVDAKYKAHFELLARRGWGGLSDEVRAEHRADLHQALAYASLADLPQIGLDDRLPATVATVTSGRRRVRLVLAAIPFGYRNPEHRERCLKSLRELLAA